MQYEYAHSPKWRTRNSFNIMVKFVGNDYELPFVACQDDTDEFNREIFERAKNGDFGVIDTARESISRQVWDSVQAIRDEKMNSGGCCVDGLWYHSDTHSKLQQIAMLLAGESLPDGLMWKTMSGQKILMTPTLIKSIYYAQMFQEQAIFTFAENLKSQIDVVEFPEQIDIYTDWPKVYTK